jgi:hypothetical protein
VNFLSWDDVITSVRNHVVRISTPHGSGTGFLVSVSGDGVMCAVATAAHVVDQAHYWEQPIRITHYASGKTVVLRVSERAMFLDEPKDTAAVMFQKGELPFPEKPLDLAPENKVLKVGHEIGWVGFPAVAPNDLCFFSGRVSASRKGGEEYLVDGVAINGVSGGPAFWNGGDRITMIGVMSAYIANRSTGETLPGLTVVQNVTQFHEVTKLFKSIDEAKAQEATPQEPPPSPVAPAA